MGDRVAGAHTDLHSDQGAPPGEHSGRSRDPIIKVHEIAWLEFEKPDVKRWPTPSAGPPGTAPGIEARQEGPI